MYKKATLYSLHRLVSVFLLLLLLFSNTSHGGITSVHAQGKTGDVSGLIDQAIDRHNNNPSFDYLYSRVSLIVNEPWAYADVIKLDKASGEIIPTHGSIILAHQDQNGIWGVRVPEDGEAFNAWLDQIPTSIVDDLGKQLVAWHSPSENDLSAAATVSGHYLPWPSPIGARVTQNYNAHGTGQIDFVPDTGDIVATKDGTIVYVNDTHWKNGYGISYSNYNNVVVIRHSASEFSIYLHLKQNSIPSWIKSGCPNGPSGQTCSVGVQRGAKIGEMGTTGYSSGNHLHLSTGSSFYVDTNNSDWADEDGDGNTTELTYTAFTLSHITADFVEYSYDTLKAWTNSTTNKVYSQNSGGSNCNNPSPNGDQIGLYADDNYCGTAKILGVGDYNSPGSLGFPNDSLSSIKVGGNVKATLCKDDNYAGGCEEFSGNDSHLGDNSIGDNSASSVKVAWRNNCSPNADQVAFFADPNYGGACVVRGIGNYPDPGSMGIANDSVSSIKVGGNVRLTLYGDNDYQSTSEAFTGDDSDLSNNSIGSDRASSARVEARNNTLPGDYGLCAEEGQTCAFSGTALIYYGANNQFVGPVSKSDGVTCSNDVFGDPIPGTHKACYIKGGRPAGSTYCASENGTCSFGSTKIATVYFGANGKYNRKDNVSSSIACNTSTFGDPFSGIGKACYYILTGDNLTTPSNPNPADNTTFPRTNSTVLSYSTNGTACTIHIWGGSIDISPGNNCSSLTLGNQRGGAYNWQVTASNGSGSVTGPIWHFNIKPYAPSNLTIGTSSGTQVTLNWTLSSDEPGDIDEYEIYRNGEYVGYATNGISTYTVTGLDCSSSYSFFVKSKRQGVLSDATNTVTRGAVGCVPAQPSDLTIANATLHSLTLNWQDNSNNENGFKIYRWGHNGTDWGFYYLATVGANVESFTQANLVCGSDFNYYEVSAFNATGESDHVGWIQGATSPCPDLVPYPREGRADPVIVSPVAGTVTNDILTAGKDAYFDWGFTNLGNASVNANYHVDLYIDEHRFIHYPFDWMGVEAMGGFDDWSEPWTQPGWHTVRLIVDPDNTIDESNEDNNIWQADFYWEPDAADSYEPDNTSGQAKTLNPNSSQTRSIHPAADVDWVKFTLNTSSAVVLETTGLTGSDTQMWLYDNDLNELEYSDDEGAGLYSLIDLSCETGGLSAGTYYIKIGEYESNDEIPAYDLSLSTPACSRFDIYTGAIKQTSQAVSIPGSTRLSLAGVSNGPVKIVNLDSDPSIVAERVVYKVNGVNTSFTEMMGLPDHQLDSVYWLPWYNNVELDTQLRFANVSGSTANVHVYIGDEEMNGSPFSLGPGASTRKSFAGVNNGPVKIQSNVPIVAAERVVYKVNGVNTSFTEMMGLPDGQLDAVYWLPWYNNVELDTQLRFANVSNSTANVHVYIGNVEMQGSPFTLSPGESTRKSFAGVNNGPVKIQSNVPIVAAERVVYKVNGVNTSFTEMMGLPDSQLDTVYWLPWYNNVELDTQLRFANVSGSTANVHVYIGNVEMQGSPFTLSPGESTRKSFAGVNNGPVKIQSNVPIVAAERVVYKVNGVNTSFIEMMGLPDSQLDTIYWLPWYNNIGDLDTQLRFANVSNSTANVHVFIGGLEMQGSPFTLSPGESTRKSFAGMSNGPVKIVSNVPIVAAERVVYKVSGIPTSFSEMMGLPNSQLNTSYWLPWYNNVELDTQLRFGVP